MLNVLVLISETILMGIVAVLITLTATFLVAGRWPKTDATFSLTTYQTIYWEIELLPTLGVVWDKTNMCAVILTHWLICSFELRFDFGTPNVISGAVTGRAVSKEKNWTEQEKAMLEKAVEIGNERQIERSFKDEDEILQELRLVRQVVYIIAKMNNDIVIAQYLKDDPAAQRAIKATPTDMKQGWLE